MKKRILSLFVAGLIVLSSSTVYADEITEKIADLESRIAVIEQEIADLKAEYVTEEVTETESIVTDNEFSFTSEGHTFTYLKNEIVEDYEGKDRVLIYFEYTNNTGETVSPSYSLNVTAFQNGIQLDFAGWLGSEIQEEEFYYKEVKDGTTIPIAIGYSIMDKSDISIEICPFFYTDETPIGEYTFSLSK